MTEMVKPLVYVNYDCNGVAYCHFCGHKIDISNIEQVSVYKQGKHHYVVVCSACKRLPKKYQLQRDIKCICE